MIKLLVTLIFVFSIGIMNAQMKETIDNIFQGTRLVNGQSANLADKGALLLQIQHRFEDISGGAYEFFGLDQATMRIGFEYGFGDNFNFGFGRSTYLKTYDLFGKFRFVQQSNSFPVSAVVSLGGSLPTVHDFFPDMYDNFSDKFSGNAQLFIARTFKNIGMQLSTGYLNAGFNPYENKNISTVIYSIGGSAKLSKRVSVNVEYLHAINNEISTKSPLSAGIDIDTGGHLFQLVLSNSQQMFDQALFTDTTGDWAKGNLFFGFNLIREFDINKAIEF